MAKKNGDTKWRKKWPINKTIKWYKNGDKMAKKW